MPWKLRSGSGATAGIGAGAAPGAGAAAGAGAGAGADAGVGENSAEDAGAEDVEDSLATDGDRKPFGRVFVFGLGCDSSSASEVRSTHVDGVGSESGEETGPGCSSVCFLEGCSGIGLL